ncbi:hypothetical protein MHPYR_430059 [uncultured Mycobacterium sp.]|uniref:Uncharacterized protein n=1 Tax=uncultured Mycobacterium sp. TaxID=171292 RepID=A0A1Y5PJ72_9MYCO|nr:hypothetical protein MHPYR_430059 [uncultured Mycobacterium sp.]
MPRSRCWRTYSPAALSGLTRDAALAVLAHLLAGRAVGVDARCRARGAGAPTRRPRCRG